MNRNNEMYEYYMYLRVIKFVFNTTITFWLLELYTGCHNPDTHSVALF